MNKNGLYNADIIAIELMFENSCDRVHSWFLETICDDRMLFCL